MTKMCPKCNSLLEISKENFSYKKGRFSNVCKRCSYLKEKERRLKDKDYKAKRKRYYESNKKEYLEKCRQYRLSKVKPKANNDPNTVVFKKRPFALSLYIKNNYKSCKYLSYTIDELKKHLEAQFAPWMNWNNLGNYSARRWKENDKSTWTWQIDHIIPLADFDYTEYSGPEFEKCWALSNLRPLSSKVNVFDGVKRNRHTKPKRKRVLVHKPKKINLPDETIELIRQRTLQGIGSRLLSKELNLTRHMIKKVVSYCGIDVSGRKTPHKEQPSEKVCKGCLASKKIEEFRKHNNSYEARCHDCDRILRNVKNKAVYHQDERAIKIFEEKDIQQGVLFLQEFAKERKNKVGKCNNCDKEFHIFNDKNNGVARKYCSNECHYEWNKNRFMSKPSNRLRIIISNYINSNLRSNNSSKEGSCVKYLPYTMKELKDHLERQFEPWMNWDNWGQYSANNWDDNDSSTWKWNIDHIIPVSCFECKSMKDEGFQKCWGLDNLRPYSAKQNILDGTSRIRHNVTYK